MNFNIEDYEWKPIEGFPNYEVSDHGTVCKLLKNGKREHIKYYIDYNDNNQRYVFIENDKYTRKEYIYILLAEAWFGAKNDGRPLFIGYKNGNPNDDVSENMVVFQDFNECVKYEKENPKTFFI